MSSRAASNFIARRIVTSCFGGSLYQQGRGYYVALELFAILRGHQIAGTPLLADGEAIRPFFRTSHDYARRIATDSGDLTNEDREKVDEAAIDSLRALFSSIAVEIPGRRKAPEWFNLHLYPYVGELIHYDAVRSRGARRPQIERYTYRGGGVVAHEILRRDPDRARLERTRFGLASLVGDSGSALGRIASALHHHDAATEKDAFSGGVEAQVDLDGHQTDWIELLRAGVCNIVSRELAPTARRIEHLMHWVPYCIARHQLDLASLLLDRPPMTFLVDFRDGSSAIRTLSREGLEQARWTIVHALRAAAVGMQEEPDQEQQRSTIKQLLSGGDSWTNGPRAFFTETLAAVGALNSSTGRRHFTLQLPLLESVVHALLKPGEEMQLDGFMTDHMFQRLRLVIDERSASQARLAESIDLADFRDNGSHAARALRALGLLSEFSDATQMVHAEVRQ
ncbi:hypothetical protein ACQPZA_26060 [Pseudonocardia xinjiangensis]|uniref:hypothetical protein n=1 Tax=Pseudonocardia xinjiangensis TaxID=75289 RepID=UPI003D906FD8